MKRVLRPSARRAVLTRKELEARLAEAEAAIAAMASGQVDGFIPEDSGTPMLVRQAQDALRASEERFRALVENGSDAVALLAADGSILYMSLPVKAMLGYCPEELIGVKAFDLNHPDDNVRAQQVLASCLQQPGRTFRTDLRVRHKDGTYRHLDIVLTNRMEQRSINALVSNFRDVTQERRSQAVMAELASIVQSSEDAIIGKTLDGIVTSWNPAAQKLYGYSAEEAIGKSIEIIVPADRLAEYRLLMESIRGGEAVYQLETVRIRKDRTTVDISLAVSPIRDAAGCVVGASAIARDITERKRLREQLQQSQKLDAVGALAGGVAHDFNNVLSVILGCGAIALRHLAPGDPARQRVEQIQHAADKAADLVRHLLAFSRKQVMLPRVLDLNAVVAEMEVLLRRLIGEDVQLVTVFETKLGRVKADPAQLEQVLMNLAVNARDAMPRGGRLVIETSNAELDDAYVAAHPGARPGRFVLLSVSDTGTGMDKETQRRIFEPFFTTKEDGRGTGLGLSTAYGIVKQSGGYVWVYSELGIGTTFKVYLPVDWAAATVAACREPDSPIPRGCETLLLVEDEDGVREVAAEILTAGGYVVHQARSAHVALDMVSRQLHSIALVITDVVMPVMSGVELAAQLAVLKPEIKCLFLSGYTEKALLHHGIVESAVPFLQKPFTAAGLSRKVREVLDS